MYLARADRIVSDIHFGIIVAGSRWSVIKNLQQIIVQDNPMYIEVDPIPIK